jgi:hypothetical protein
MSEDHASDEVEDGLRALVGRILARLAGQTKAAACSPIPTNCPFTKRLPKRRDYIAEAIEDGLIPCCRMVHRRWFYRNEPPLCQVQADEVYRLFYDHAFGEHAVILIGRRRDEVTVERRYFGSTFSKAEGFRALLTDAEWQRWLDAVMAAEFWSLPRQVCPEGMWLDGYNVIVEARRDTEFRAVDFSNPDVERFWMLGRVAFDLGGLPDVLL